MGGKRGYGVPQPKGGVNGGANGFARAGGSSHYSRYFRTETIPLMTITNGTEVLRVNSIEAEEYFSDKGKWFYTTKAIYKQYTESLKPNSKIPAPKFTITVMNSKGVEEVINTHVYIN